jgi:hypothetical protein
MTVEFPTLPERQRIARELAVLRAAVRKDAELLDYWADSIGMVRAAQAVRMRKRRDELNQLLNAAHSATPDVPARQ